MKFNWVRKAQKKRAAESRNNQIKENVNQNAYIHKMHLIT
jgi:hypothetical protein